MSDKPLYVTNIAKIPGTTHLQAKETAEKVGNNFYGNAPLHNKMVCKIQRHAKDAGESMMFYNQDRTCLGHIHYSQNDLACKKISQMILQGGRGKEIAGENLKAYFWAELESSDGIVRIYVDKLAPWQNW